jgi:hypothetical protein
MVPADQRTAIAPRRANEPRPSPGIAKAVAAHFQLIQQKLLFSVLGMCWVGTFLARVRATQNGDRLLLSLLGLQNLQRPELPRISRL